MIEFLGPVLSALPEWMRLPNLTFSLPHEIYWSGLLLFPLLTMYLVKRAEASGSPRISIAIAYLLWLWGGFVGLHRFYLSAFKLALVYVALFILLLYGNSQGTLARNEKSGVDNDLKIAEFMVTRAEKDVEQGRDGAAAKLEAAREKLAEVQGRAASAAERLERWHAFVGLLFYVIAAGLIVDALLIPALARRCAEREVDKPPPREFEIMERGARADRRALISTPFTRVVGAISGFSGRFVAYWSMLAVFVYYYEVIARYVFNSPTNWAHESMFLMFGMQYLLAGAYAYREDAHVRVDVIYAKFDERTRAVIDIVTSFFFFVFATTLMVTGFLFARDAVAVMEVSFTEWAIQYWPVKITIALGAFLILLQGLAKLVRDVTFVLRYQDL